MAFTNDGTRLVVVAAPRGAPVISVRDAATLEPVGPSIELAGFRPCDISTSCWATHFVLTPDSRSVVTASDAGELTWWSLETGLRTRTMAIRPGQEALALSPDGRQAAVGTDEGILLIDLISETSRTAAGGFTRSPNRVRYSPDGTIVMSANADGTVTLWDTTSAVVRETFHGHSGLALQSAFSPDGATLYTVSGDGTAIAWDLAGTRSVRRAFTLPGGGGAATSAPRYAPVHPGRLSPDGRLVAVGLSDHGVGLWNTADLTPAGDGLADTGGEVRALAFSPDGLTMAAATEYGRVTVWNVATHSQRYPPIYASGWYLLPGLAFTPDGSTLITASPAAVETWNAATGARLDGFAQRLGASDLALSADGALAAFATFPESGAEVWDVAQRSVVTDVDGDPEADEYTVALSPDARTLAVGGYGRYVRLWDVQTGQLMHELDQGGARPLSLEFSPDGRSILTAGTMWDVSSGTRIGPNLTPGFLTSMTDLSPDGRQVLVTTPDGQVAVWDVDPASWAERACALANRTLTPDEWDRFLPGRPYEPACTR